MRVAPSAIGAALACFAAFAPSCVVAGDVEAFYKGRQIRLIIGAEAGSDYDVWGRIVARYLGRYLPGKPAIVPQNMPGAGQIIATNHLFNIAERDGTVIGMIGRNMPYMALTGNPSVRFDPRKLNWIGSPETARRVCAVRAGSGVAKVEDLLEKEIMVGGAGSGTAVTQTPTLLARLLGLKLKVVEGYRSGPGVLLGIERGEIDGICITYEALASGKAADLASGKLRILFNLEPDPIPGVAAPSIYRLVRTEDQRRILAVFNSSVELGRPIVAPPGVPGERVAALRRSFEEAMGDAELHAETVRLRVQISMIPGKVLEAKVEELMRTPQELLQSVERLMR